jgi:hypothetical protein
MFWFTRLWVLRWARGKREELNPRRGSRTKSDRGKKVHG